MATPQEKAFNLSSLSSDLPSAHTEGVGCGEGAGAVTNATHTPPAPRGIGHLYDEWRALQLAHAPHAGRDFKADLAAEARRADAAKADLTKYREKLAKARAAHDAAAKALVKSEKLGKGPLSGLRRRSSQRLEDEQNDLKTAQTALARYERKVNEFEGGLKLQQSVYDDTKSLHKQDKARRAVLDRVFGAPENTGPGVLPAENAERAAFLAKRRVYKLARTCDKSGRKLQEAFRLMNSTCMALADNVVRARNMDYGEGHASGLTDNSGRSAEVVQYMLLMKEMQAVRGLVAAAIDLNPPLAGCCDFIEAITISKRDMYLMPEAKKWVAANMDQAMAGLEAVDRQLGDPEPLFRQYRDMKNALYAFRAAVLDRWAGINVSAAIPA